MTFRSASVTGLKILLAGGMMASLLALLFLHDVTKGALSSFAILAGGVSVIGLAVVVILSLAMCSKSVTTKREKLP